MPQNLQFSAGNPTRPRAAVPAAGTPGAPGAAGAVATPPVVTRPRPNPQQPLPEVDPVRVQVGAPTLDSFQEHQDAAYQQATRSLDPQWASNDRAFEQAMINKGLQPGTEAYQLAFDQNARAKTDAYASAQNYAVQQGQAAQQQAFMQNYQQSELANQLLRQREGNQTQIAIGQMGNETQQQNNEYQRLNFLDQLGFNQQQAGTAGAQWQQQFNQSGDQWDRQFNQAGNQWQQQFGMAQQGADFGQYMQMLGFDRDTTNMNNQASNQDFAQMMSMFGMMPSPQGGGGSVDYMAGLNSSQNQANANYATGTASANAQNQQYASAAMAALMLFCDENAKHLGDTVPPARCLEVANGLPIYEFTYRADITDTACIGTTAQAFNTALHGAPQPLIKVIDMMHVLLGSVQELSRQNTDLSARIAALEAA